MEAVVLEGRLVRLEPIEARHLEGLTAAAADPELWRWTAGRFDTPENMQIYVRNALERRAAGIALPFAIVERATGRIAGSTRFANHEPHHRRVEIGWSWLARACHGTGINAEAKYLMLRHAFETWDLIRVEFKTDVLNEASRRALRSIGATEEGVLRRHIVTNEGRVRDTVYYSVLKEEWPRVRAHLERKLAGRGAGGRV